MKNEHEILSTLKYFTGTEHYYKFNFGNNVLTDGVKEFCKLCECDWLLTDIDAYFLTNHKNISNSDNLFWIASLKVNEDKTAVITIKEDTNIKPIITQKIPYTTFPLKDFEFYIIKQGDYWVYLLKSEY